MRSRLPIFLMFLATVAGCGSSKPTPPAIGVDGPELAPPPRLTDSNPLDVFEKTKRDIATTNCQALENAIKAFMLKPQSNGLPPTSLDELVAPAVGSPIVDGGKAALLDPWGQPYQFEMRANEYGGLDPVVTTTDPDGMTIFSKSWTAKQKRN